MHVGTARPRGGLARLCVLALLGGVLLAWATLRSPALAWARESAGALGSHAVEAGGPSPRITPSRVAPALPDRGSTPSADAEAIRSTLAQLGPGFHVTETRHFVVISDCDAQWRSRREALLERTYRQVTRFAARIGVPTRPPASKLMCVMLQDHDAYEAFGRAHDRIHHHWVAGYYAAEPNRVVLYDDRTNPGLLEAERKLEALERKAEEARARASDLDGRPPAAELEAHAAKIEAFVRDERARLGTSVDVRSEAKTIHEAAHLVAFNCGLQSRSHRYPMWVTEGLATSFETDDPERPFGPDRPYEHREAQFRDALDAGAIEPLGAFLGRTRPDGAAERADAQYAQSYALFRYLARFHRDELGALLRDIAAEPPGEISASRHVELFERRLGPVGPLERRWLRHERR